MIFCSRRSRHVDISSMNTQTSFCVERRRHTKMKARQKRIKEERNDKKPPEANKRREKKTKESRYKLGEETEDKIKT